MSDVTVQLNPTALAYLLEDEDGPVGRDLERRCLNVEVEQKRLLSQHGTGRVYRRKGRVHQASAPGQPPAVDTGHLRATIGHQVHHDAAEGRLVGDVGSGANPAIPGTKKAEWLEKGTRRMAPRPFLRPSLRAASR